MPFLELEQMICPSCGANITTLNPYQGEIVCPYCHGKSLNPLVADEATWVPETMVVFSKTKEDFLESFVKELAKERLNTAIYNGIKVKEISQFYVPMYVFHNRTNSILCLACKTDNMPSGFNNLFAINEMDYAASAQKFNPKLMHLNEGIKSFVVDSDSSIVWEYKGKPFTNNSSDIPSYESLMLLSVWYLVYEYNNIAYYYMMTGDGKTIKLSSPFSREDKENDDAVVYNYPNRPKAPQYTIGWIFFLTALTFGILLGCFLLPLYSDKDVSFWGVLRQWVIIISVYAIIVILLNQGEKRYEEEYRRYDEECDKIDKVREKARLEKKLAKEANLKTAVDKLYFRLLGKQRK